MTQPDSLEAFLAAQRADYRAGLPNRLAQLEAAWAADAPEALERCAHGMAGSAATFGLAPLGDAARVLEEALEAWAATGQPWDAGQRAAVAPLLQALRGALRDAGVKQSPSPG